MYTYGQRSFAIGTKAKPIPTGRCRNCCSEEIKMALQKADDEFLLDKKYNYPIKEKIEAIKSNPIDRCIFCKNDGLCYFAGDCELKMSID